VSIHHRDCWSCPAFRALLLVAPLALVPIIYSFVRSKQLERLGQL
jgi:hypothetical protein